MKKFFTIGLLISMLYGCGGKNQIPCLVPVQPCKAANYWCTWYWQNYLINKGQEVTNPDPVEVYSNHAAREQMNEETIFGENGMAKVILPESRGDYYFLIDHGWQDKHIKPDTFFTLVLDTLDFPRYAHREPKERIKQMNEDIKALGWRGLGLWVRGNISQEQAMKFVLWSKYAGIEYWKIDGGDIQYYYCYHAKQEVYPELQLEYVTGSGGPLNTKWDTPNLKYYASVYEPITKHAEDPNTSFNYASRALETLKNSDVFRTYDAVPLLVSTVTLQRIHDILKQTAGNPEYIAHLNIQDDCNIAAALGLLVAVKRHPMNTPRLFEGKDYHLQIAGDRHVDKRLNEMGRFVRWQRIAPPMPAGYGYYLASDKYLLDSIKFNIGDTWKKDTWGKMVRQSAPAIMSRNIALPVVKADGEPPYVMAAKFPNGAVGISTEGRVIVGNSWYHPRADIVLSEIQTGRPIGIFGHYKSLTLVLDKPLPGRTMIIAQDLLADKATEITRKVEIINNTIKIPGELIDKLGTSAGTEGDISVPGLVLRIDCDKKNINEDECFSR